MTSSTSPFPAHLPAHFTARTPVDLLAVVPHVLGFHPEESVVLLSLGPGESFHARTDLPLDDLDRREVIAQLCEVVARRPRARVAFVVYTADPGAATAFAVAAERTFGAAGVEVVGGIRVHDDRFHLLGDPDDPGTPYDLRSHPFTADQVLRGRVVHDTRESLARSLDGDDPVDTEQVAAAADRTADRLIAVGDEARPGSGRRVPLQVALADELRGQARWLQATIRRALPDPSALSAAEAGRLLVLVALDSVREVAWAEITRDRSAEHVELWRQLLRRTPQDLRAGPASLLAYAAWLHGKGALAWCALERCFGLDPEDSLGLRVAVLLETATPPAVWTPVLESDLKVFADGGDEERDPA